MTHDMSRHIMSDKPDMAEIKKFDVKNRRRQLQEKNPLPSEETIEQKQADKSYGRMCRQYALYIQRELPSYFTYFSCLIL
ncbi:thymosin beta-4-like [Symphalangus syndactylus]|uniref:thymosin beta-4-like n=1 Tax=Symphalangus syndactylus TaxID=9590 RepID=UPI0024423F45|nr:thymosin beta-4-like [Symphalangus syndactylus]